MYIIYGLFILQCLISLIYTNNLYISTVDITRHLVLFITVTALVSLMKNIPFKFYHISLIISLFLIYEVIASLSPLIHFIYNNGLNFSIISSINIDSLKGITGNRNITTASIVIKTPFIFYLLYNSKSLTKYFFSILLFITTLPLFLINSRAALLSLIFILLSTFITLILHKRKKLIILIFIGVPIALSLIFAKSLVPAENSDTVERLASIEFSNESSSQRFFLWENAFDYIIKHPFVASGIGNWKVESAAYWGSYGDRYLVPFHAHNDFIEFSTEIGVIGGLTYLLLFLFVMLKLLAKYLKSKDLKFLTLLLSFLAIFIDSCLNFPFERPIIQTMFVVILSLSIYYNEKEIR